MNLTGDSPRLAPSVRDLRMPLAGAVVAAIAIAVVAAIANWGDTGAWAVGLGGAAVGVLLVAREIVAASDRELRKAALELMGVGVNTSAVEGKPGELHPERVVAFVGHSRSGKSSIARKLHELHPEWGWASCGAYVRAEAKRRGFPAEPPFTHKFGDELVHKLGGEEFLKRVLAESLVTPDAKTLVIDDIYHLEVYEALVSRWPHLTFVGFEAPKSIGGALGLKPPVGVSESPLDEEVERLTVQHPPAVRLEAATSEAEAQDRTARIEQLLVAV